MLKSVVNTYGEMAQADMVIEECSELIYAISKLKRAGGMGYKSEIDQEEAYKKVIKEMAHVRNAIISLQYILGIDERDMENIILDSDKKAYTLAFGHEPDEEELDKEFFLAVNRIHE